jgi:predicted O-methyltransferase YrrM
MKFETICSYLEGIGSGAAIPASRAKGLYEFILAKKPSECLELGFAQGVSSCYTAAALDEFGTGHLTSVDLVPAMKWQKPAIEELLA